MKSINGNKEWADFIQFLEAWHANRLAQLNQLVESAKEGTKIRIGQEETDLATLNKDMAAGMKIGAYAAIAIFEKLPFSVSKPDADQDESADDFDEELS